MRPAALASVAATAIAVGAGALGVAHAAQVAQRPVCDPARYTVDAPPLPEGWTLQFDCGPAPDGVAGLAYEGAQTIVVYLHGHATHDGVRWTIAHETGHAWDFAALDEVERLRWQVMRDLRTPDWRYGYTGDPVDDRWHESPGEDFAEAFAYCHIPDPALPRVRDFTPPGEQECGLIRDVAGGAR